ncbi:MAG: class II fructose-bisphosphate aldolase [Candidatus Altiarchaeota archaeon]|nr:class II fructose-bisphosphate aldolase [Candidatus Altiarchaeota archaeon]
MTDCKPISGKKMFDALRDKDCIIMAVNTRYIPGVAEGILRAARDTNSPVLVEIARSECDLKGGYTGYTPKDFAKRIMKAAKKVGCSKWVLHADHISVKSGDAKTIKGTKELVKAQIDAGFTSFAIDASHIFNFKGKNEKEELEGNLKATIEIADLIKERMKEKGVKSYGLEVEVGEVGRKDDKGFLLTTAKQATTFIKELNKADIHPQLLAIANGSTHGNIYDARGVKIEQVSIDIPRTKGIARSLRRLKLDVRIAQHGITGTPLNLIATEFPRGDVLKGNVGTFWQNIVWDVLKVYEIDLYKKIRRWVLKTYAGKGKSDDEIFGKNSKYAFKHFFKEMHSIDKKTVKAMEAQAYASALMFFKAFNSIEKGKLVRG